MAVTEKQILESISARKFAPVYLLTGDEDYYIDLITSYFEEKIISPELRDFNQMVLYGLDTDVQTVVNMAQHFPMMSDVQLIIVKEAQYLSRGGREDDWLPLLNYLQSPMASSVLVLCFKHKKFDKRTKVYKAIDKAGVVYEKNKLKDNQVPDWVSGYVSQRGYSITQKGAMLMAEFKGNELEEIVNDLSKIFVNLPVGSVIDENVIEQNVGISKDYNIFELQNAIGRRDAYKCNKIVNYFADNPKDNPMPVVIASLYSYIIKIMIFLQEPDKNLAMKNIGVSPYFMRDYEVAASNYKLGKLASCIGYLHDADLKSKGVNNNNTISDGDLLKELIFKIIH